MLHDARTPAVDLDQCLPVVDGKRTLRDQGIDEGTDRTYELKLLGPARQYDVVGSALMRRADVLGVEFD